MPDPLRANLVSESASGMASASISPPGATRNCVRFACVICCGMLRFAPFLGHFTPILSSSRLGERQGPAALRHQEKRVATFALVTTVGSQPRPARSTPGEPGRAANRQACASLSYPTDRHVVRNPHVGRPGFLVSTSTRPRTAVRRGRHAGLLLITVLPKTLRTIPTYIVYDIVTQCFGHEPLCGQ